MEEKSADTTRPAGNSFRSKGTHRATPLVCAIALVLLTGTVGCSRGSEGIEVPVAPHTPRVLEAPGDQEPDGETGEAAGVEDPLLEEMDRAFQELQQATTDEERAEAQRRLRELERRQQAQPYAQQPTVEAVSWEEGLRWWPYRPLLKAEPAPQGSAERLFIGPIRDGQRPDPRRDPSGFTVLYEFEPHTADATGYQRIIDGRGIFILTLFFPPGSLQESLSTHRSARLIEVRGHQAVLEERRRPEDDVDRRSISWREALPGGGYLFWSVDNSSERYDTDESIAFVDRLIEVNE